MSKQNVDPDETAPTSHLIWIYTAFHVCSVFKGLTLCMLSNFSCLCRPLLTFFKNNFSFMNAFRVSNGLDPDQDRQSVGPELGPNCLQMLSAADKSLAEYIVLKYM